MGCGVTPAGQGNKQEIIMFLQFFDVLKRQARSALLPDAVFTTILDQLSVSISYEPLQCQTIILDLEMDRSRFIYDSRGKNQQHLVA
ncbi:hypothetical protein KIN20_003273 [Parelaphostrongylus tenuis]|uniref:Uncharacterized protein n=1 Tax=Parelaphostrongylus tenuis TaxID=148309 RepID=A0AAD5QE78_PARTN|nr:hypothetical protein KIN20_003273 [Parelaphostrongylus tenuis]